MWAAFARSALEEDNVPGESENIDDDDLARLLLEPTEYQQLQKILLDRTKLRREREMHAVPEGSDSRMAQ